MNIYKYFFIIIKKYKCFFFFKNNLIVYINIYYNFKYINRELYENKIKELPDELFNLKKLKIL